MSDKGFSRSRFGYSVNERFFGKWSTQMAYVLGFTYSDGNIYRSSISWDIQKRDKDLLVKINKAMNSNYPIKERPHSVRLRISNSNLIASAAKQGLMKNKSKRMILPYIPTKFISHFMRGFLDGDGWIVLRNGRNEVDIGFVSGNKKFLENISSKIFEQTRIKGRVRAKFKITPNNFRSTTYLMEYYSNKAIKIGNWIYSHLSSKDLMLKRKYTKYLEAVKLYDYLNSGKKEMIRALQENFGKHLKDILNELYNYNNFSAVEIADVLGVHHSSTYRWLDKFGIRKVVHNGIYE